MKRNAIPDAETTEVLIDLGIPRDEAERISLLIPLFRRLAPEPDRDALEGVTQIVGERIWGKQVWQQLLGLDVAGAIALEQLAQKLLDRIRDTNLLPLLQFLRFAAGWDPNPSTYPAGHSIMPIGHDAKHKARKREKLGEMLFTPETSDEIAALKNVMIDAATHLLARIDQAAFADGHYSQMREASLGLGIQPPPPAGLLVSWLSQEPVVNLSTREWFALTFPELADGAGQFPETETIVNAVVRVFYATDRNIVKTRDRSKLCKAYPQVEYGSEWAEMTYGFCEVSIPASHEMGQLESPSVWRLEVHEDTARHVVLHSTLRVDEARFYEEMKNRLRHSEHKAALLFVHGYNVSFEDAARRTAQMAYDLEFGGVPILFSWPSKKKTLLYSQDEQTIELSKANLKTLISRLIDCGNPSALYLVAHSMGSRGLAAALGEIFDALGKVPSEVKEVILAAPDIDARIFKRDIAPKLRPAQCPVTVYASSNDRALKISKKFHDGPRVGDTEEGPCILPPIQTIDASNVDTSLLGHSYFAGTRTVLSDIFYILRHSTRAEDRSGLVKKETAEGTYWAFKP
jgi:esterase/lipase superfamily enzyme